MTDAQQLFDFARRQFNEIAVDVERHFDLVASQLRDWMPADSQFIQRALPAKRLPPPTTLQLAQRWVDRNRALTAAIVAFAVTGSVGAIVYVRQTQHRRKRRAKKSASGARTDVVVVAGNVASPLMNAIYMDLERRGFVVYVVSNTAEQERFIRSQARSDLIPLHLDLVDPVAAQGQVARLQDLLAREHRAFDEADSHRLNFAGLVLVSDLQNVEARVEEISSEEWSNALNAQVLNTIATTQLFLPVIAEHKSRILFLTPSVTASLKMPSHSLENTVYGALEGFITTLTTEVKDSGVSISHFKLGNIDIPSATARQRREGVPAPRLKATPVRRLYESVFDALTTKRPSRTWHVGRGSLAYDIIGRWMPAGAVGWLMGFGRRPNVVEENGSEIRGEEVERSVESLVWEKIEQEND